MLNLVSGAGILRHGYQAVNSGYQSGASIVMFSYSEQ